MHLNAPELLQPVFDFIDGIIRDYGDILFLLFTYVAIPFLVWVLCGGLRRTLLTGKGKRGTSTAPVIVIYLPLGLSRPPPEPLPPLIGQDYEPPCCNHDDDCSRD